MRIREYGVIDTPSVVISHKKDVARYKSTYSISIYDKRKDTMVTITCQTRKDAKEELIRLLRLYTKYTKTEILRGEW